MTEDHFPVTQQQWREFKAVNDERHRDLNANIEEIRGARNSNRKCKYFRSDLTHDENMRGTRSACDTTSTFSFVSRVWVNLDF